MASEKKPRRRAPSKFFSRCALLMLAMVLLAFPFTYFGPIVSGSRHFLPVYHIHGLLFFGWIGLFAWQTHLVASGGTARHRELGLAGIAISALMVPLGVILAIEAVQRRTAEGDPHPFDNTLYNVIDITCFTVLMIASISAVTRHIEWHRRFTFGAAVVLVGPAISRWIFHPWFITIPQFSPLSDMAPNLIADAFLIALAVHDRRTLGRVHAATLWLCLILIPVHVVTPFLTASDWWRGLAPFITKLG